MAKNPPGSEAWLEPYDQPLVKTGVLEVGSPPPVLRYGFPEFVHPCMGVVYGYDVLIAPQDPETPYIEAAAAIAALRHRGRLRFVVSEKVYFESWLTLLPHLIHQQRISIPASQRFYADLEFPNPERVKLARPYEATVILFAEQARPIW